MSFARLLDDLGAEQKRRAAARETAMLVERIYHRGRPFKAAVGELEVMTKAMAVDMAQSRASQRQAAIAALANINRKATEMARAGELTGEQGAYLDIVIAHTAERIRAL